MTEPLKKRRRERDLLHSLLFSAALVLPGIGMLLGVNDPKLLSENRRLAPAPAWPRTADDWLELPATTQKWFDDHFGFRTHLIRTSGAVAWYGARETIPMTVGRDGWLFLFTERRAGKLECVRLPAAQRAAWTALGEERARRLDPYGVRFLWVMAPNKQTVYPEFLPASTPRETCEIESPLTHAPEGIEFVDLRPTLMREKAGVHIYHKTDSHWNQLGALHAAREILGRLAPSFPGMRVPALADFEVRVRRGVPGGDCARQLRVYGEEYKEDLVVLTASAPPRARPVDGSPPLDPFRNIRAQKQLTLETGDPDLPTALVFHDSFMHAMMPVFAEQFRRTVFIHSDGALDETSIARERPDIVISLFLESRLLEPPPADHWLP